MIASEDPRLDPSIVIADAGQNSVYGMVSLARMEAKLYDCRVYKLRRGHIWSSIGAMCRLHALLSSLFNHLPC